MKICREVVRQLAIDHLGLNEVYEECFHVDIDCLQAFANAIAKWQREKDAELCEGIKKFYTKHYEIGADECAKAILNQGEE